VQKVKCEVFVKHENIIFLNLFYLDFVHFFMWFLMVSTRFVFFCIYGTLVKNEWNKALNDIFSHKDNCQMV
jgi:hypothetical protein